MELLKNYITFKLKTMKEFKDYELDQKELIPFGEMHKELKLPSSFYGPLDGEDWLTIYVSKAGGYSYCQHQIAAIKQCDTGALLGLKGFNALEKEADKYERIFNESKKNNNEKNKN